ncbi:MAG: alanine--glyoxylate aminotransferase family protein [Acidobacteriota bacterium]|nr:alanine--glyoxylate aminotransferase family protein [Acidobacteriota bacterium]
MDPLLLIPGPSPVVPRILAALGRPTVSHVGGGMVEDTRQALDHLKRIVFTRDGQPFLMAGAGTLAMEVALLNLARPGERILILSQGYFGDRMGEICRAYELEHDLVQSPWGAVTAPADLARRLAERPYGLVVSTHVDTGSGGCAPVREYAEAARAAGALFVLDGVCATGGIEERMDDWGIDVILTAAQKCFGAPPGLAIDVFSPAAMSRRKSLHGIKAYYADVLRWLPVMTDPGRYFSTPSVNEHRAFAEATRIIMEEGMDNRFRRQARLGRAARAGLAALGFELFTGADCLADTLSVVRYPAGLDDASFRTSYARHGVQVAGGLAATAGRVFRMGHMGNLTDAQLEFAFEALEAVLTEFGRGVETGMSLRAVRAALDEPAAGSEA